MLAGAIPALMITGMQALWSLVSADSADRQHERNHLQQAADAATERADQAESEAAARYTEQHARAERLHQ